MRIGSGQSSKKDEDKTISYENQNNQLKRLHEERLKRQQQGKNHTQMRQQTNSQLFKKQQKTSSTKQSKKVPQNIFLNSLLSDQRSIKQKSCAISLSSLFQEDPRTFSQGISKKIKSVLMTTYGYVMDVLGPIAQSGVPFVLVNDSPQNGQGRIQRNHSGFSNMSLVIPPRTNKGYGVFHTKLWLIRFESFLRIVICTGNQHAEDWIIWLNAYWYQDFPLKGMKLSDYDEKVCQNEKKSQNNQQQQNSKKQESKQQALKNNNKKQKEKKQQILIDPNVISLLQQSSDDEIIEKNSKKPNKKPQQKPKQVQQKPFNYENDFKQTLALVLNNMFPKSFDLMKQTGIDMSKYDFSQVKVVLIPSIPGRHTIKDGSMKKFGMAKVKNVLKEIGPKIKKGSLTYNSSSLGVVEQNFLSQIYFSFLPYAQSFSTTNYKLIYPSYKYITQQTCGQAQVLFLKKQNYYRSSLKKQVFYHYEPSRINCVKGAIPHLKTVVIQDLENKQKNECIFFMGSHNMTKAAWGTYEKGDSQLSFSNSQLGLLFVNMEKDRLMNFLPYHYPPKKYADYDKPFLKD